MWQITTYSFLSTDESSFCNKNHSYSSVVFKNNHREPAKTFMVYHNLCSEEGRQENKDILNVVVSTNSEHNSKKSRNIILGNCSGTLPSSSTQSLPVPSIFRALQSGLCSSNYSNSISVAVFKLPLLASSIRDMYQSAHNINMDFCNALGDPTSTYSLLISYYHNWSLEEKYHWSGIAEKHIFDSLHIINPVLEGPGCLHQMAKCRGREKEER